MAAFQESTVAVRTQLKEKVLLVATLLLSMTPHVLTAALKSISFLVDLCCLSKLEQVGVDPAYELPICHPWI